jgi:hypothetical protein
MDSKITMSKSSNNRRKLKIMPKREVIRDHSKEIKKDELPLC